MKGLYEEGGLATEDADLIFTSLPINILEIMHTKIQENINKLDHDLSQSLENVGFKLDPYPSGMLIKYFRSVYSSHLFIESSFSFEGGSAKKTKLG
jgi:hypothetical protein